MPHLRDHRLLIGAVLFLLIHVWRILILRIQQAVLVSEDQAVVLSGRPFLRCFLKSCSLTVFLLKLAADAPWNQRNYAASHASSGGKFCPLISSNGNAAEKAAVAYSVLTQEEEEDGDEGSRQEDRQSATTERDYFDHSSWEPIRHEGSSDEGSDLSSTEAVRSSGDRMTRRQAASPLSSKKRSKVRFSRFSEVRTLTASEADAALFARLSYEASVQAQVDAAKAAFLMKPGRTVRLALQLSFLHFSASFLQTKVTSDTGLPYVDCIIVAAACLACFVAGLLCWERGSSADQQDSLTPQHAISLLLLLLSLLLTTISVSRFQSFSSLTQLHPLDSFLTEAAVSAILQTAFVLWLRRSVPDPDRLDISLFLGLSPDSLAAAAFARTDTAMTSC